MSALPNGSLLESHELRLQVVEGRMPELMSATASNGVKLEAIQGSLMSIDAKLDGHMGALERHKAEDQGVALRVHDLEARAEDQDEKKKTNWANKNLAFWTIVAGLAGDLCLRFIEHAHILAGLFGK